MRIFSIVQSVLAAAFGVQSSAKRESDFTSGKPIHFIVAGIVSTLLFVLTIWWLVQYILTTSA